jgi:hypothetical protein
MISNSLLLNELQQKVTKPFNNPVMEAKLLFISLNKSFKKKCITDSTNVFFGKFNESTLECSPLQPKHLIIVSVESLTQFLQA